MKKDSTVKLWYAVGIGVVLLILMIIVSSILQVGDRLTQLHVYAAYAFYGLSGILLYLLILRPVWIILYSPSFSIATTLDKNPKRNYRTYKAIAKRMMKHKDIPDSAKENIRSAFGDAILLKKALEHTFSHHIKKKLNHVIRKHAKTVMISTAISQNGRLDFLTVLIVNVRMVKEIVVLCGFRPSFKNLAKLLVNVFTTALIAEGLENIKISDVLPQSTMQMLGEIPLIKPVMSSVLQGISNALLTLRIGFVTRKYLFDDSEELTKEKLRLGALVEAAKNLPIVVADGLSIFPKTIFNFFKPKSKKTTEIELDEA